MSPHSQDCRRKKNRDRLDEEIFVHSYMGLQACEEPEGICDTSCTVIVKHNRLVRHRELQWVISSKRTGEMWGEKSLEERNDKKIRHLESD